MKRFCLKIVPVCLIPFILFSLAYAEGGPENARKIDLKLTADYFKSWSSRENFPDSVTFGYYYVYSLSALGEKIRPEIKKKIIDFIKRCRKEDGGFASEPKYAESPNVIFTYYALRTLYLLGSLDAVDRAKTGKFITGLLQEDGGIAANRAKGGKATLATTYYGVMSLQILGKLDKIPRGKTAFFTKAFRNKEKGFGLRQGGGASPQATYMAIAVLAGLGSLTPEIKKGAVSYLKGTRYSGLVSNRKYRTLPQLRAMAYTIKTLAFLSALSEVNTRKMREFVESLYIPANGGFGPRPGLGTTPASTFHGIVCLVTMGKLKDPDSLYGDPHNPGLFPFSSPWPDRTEVRPGLFSSPKTCNS